MDEQSPSPQPQPKGIAGSDGSAMPYILEHYMMNPTSYEIPLRSLYALNCQTLPLMAGSQIKESSFANPPMQNSTLPLADAASQFKAQLISHISKGPHQYNLPVGFTMSFVRRVFAENLEHVDFPQALTALDYLNNLESRRKKEVIAAFGSLDVEWSLSPSKTIRVSEVHKQDMREKYPGVVRWIESIEAKERDAVSIYKEMCLSLRRWVSSRFPFQGPATGFKLILVFTDSDQRAVAGTIRQSQLHVYVEHTVQFQSARSQST
jgi:hypothetical protein